MTNATGSNALPDVNVLFDSLTERLRSALASTREEALLVGIHTGGAWVAEALHRRLDMPVPLGTLDVSYYRDDLSHGGMRPNIQSSTLPGGVDGKTIWLIDDVLHTGRTARAALNELFDFGRPAQVRLLVLIDREGHELPISADLVGARLTGLPATQRVKLIGPDPMSLAFSESPRQSTGINR